MEFKAWGNDKSLIKTNMRFFNRIIWTLLIISLFSCEGSTQTLSREFKATLLQKTEIPTESIKNRSWFVVEDTQNELPKFRKNRRTIYKIRYPHNVDSVSFPTGSEVHFAGGSIKGMINFNDNYLSGEVNVRGAILKGSIRNKQFEAGWACYGDSLHDDAFGVNQILNVCNTIHFQSGTYLMKDCHNIPESFPRKYKKKVISHIGINRSNIVFIGDPGACIYTKDSLKTICIYSTPKDLDHSIRGIKIEGMTFRNINDGLNFYEFEHTIKVAGVDGLEISNCQFHDFRGDAICLSHLGNSVKSGELSRNSNVKIVGNYIEGSSHNNRNGISVISGKNVLIDKNVIEETTKNNMPGSIDVEANDSAYTIENIVITNNRIKGSNRCGIAIFSTKKGSPANKITIANNEIMDCSHGISIFISSTNLSRDILIKENHMKNCKIPMSLIGYGKSKNWTFENNYLDGDDINKIPLKINIDNLIMK